MTPIDPTVLARVTGGASRLTPHVNDPTLLNSVTQLKSDIDTLAKSAQNAPQSSSSTMLPMMMMMMMNRQ